MSRRQRSLGDRNARRRLARSELYLGLSRSTPIILFFTSWTGLLHRPRPVTAISIAAPACVGETQDSPQDTFPDISRFPQELTP